jgi:hypothetical protein
MVGAERPRRQRNISIGVIDGVNGVRSHSGPHGNTSFGQPSERLTNRLWYADGNGNKFVYLVFH